MLEQKDKPIRYKIHEVTRWVADCSFMFRYVKSVIYEGKDRKAHQFQQWHCKPNSKIYSLQWNCDNILWQHSDISSTHDKLKGTFVYSLINIVLN